MIFQRNYFINTSSSVDVISIIHEINGAIRESALPEGLVTVTVPGPGGAVTAIEPLADIVDQFKEALRVFPGEDSRTMNRRKEEIPIAPRVAAAIIGKTFCVPMSKGKLVLAPREEVVLVDFENTSRRREFWVHIMGEAPAAQGQRGGPARR